LISDGEPKNRIESDHWLKSFIEFHLTIQVSQGVPESKTTHSHYLD
jgi:hypothetical protein